MSQYKLYLHIEESQAFPEFTFIYKSSRDSPSSVRSLIDEFVVAYRRKCGKDISTDTLLLVPNSGKCVDHDVAVVKAFDSGDDVQVRIAPATCESKPTSQSHPGLPIGVRGLQHLEANHRLDTNSPQAEQAPADYEHCERSNSQISTSQINTSQVSTSTASAKGLVGQQDGKVYLPIIKQFLERAKEAESKKYFRAACKIYKQVSNFELQSIGDFTSAAVHPECLDHTQVLKVAPSHKEALTALAQLWLTVSRPQDAVSVAREAADSAPDDPSTHRLYAECLR